MHFFRLRLGVGPGFDDLLEVAAEVFAVDGFVLAGEGVEGGFGEGVFAHDGEGLAFDGDGFLVDGVEVGDVVGQADEEVGVVPDGDGAGEVEVGVDDLVGGIGLIFVEPLEFDVAEEGAAAGDVGQLVDLLFAELASVLDYGQVGLVVEVGGGGIGIDLPVAGVFGELDVAETVEQRFELCDVDRPVVTGGGGGFVGPEDLGEFVRADAGAFADGIQ